MSEVISGNKAIEDAAIEFVLRMERTAGRTANDSRYKGAAGDIESDGRVIEVKAFAKTVRSSGFVLLETRQVEEARANPNFYLYLVENVGQGDPAAFEVRVLSGELLKRVLSHAKQRTYFEVPLPKEIYEQLVREGNS